MAESDLFLIEEGEVVQSFSGVDFNVLGYIPPFPKDADPKTEPITTDTGDVFIDRMANIQTMSISSTRDHKAARRLGSAWAFDFSRGSRTVAGSLVFAMLNGDSFKKFIGASNRYSALSIEDAGHYLPDALPPFNIVFTASNESGKVLVGLLVGVRLTNTGMSFGIHDIYTEQVYSFVAERYEPLNDLSDSDVARSSKLLMGAGRQTEDKEYRLQNGVQVALRKYYTDAFWTRPKLPTSDWHSRGLINLSRKKRVPESAPDIPDNRNHYLSPSDKKRRSRLGNIPGLNDSKNSGTL